MISERTEKIVKWVEKMMPAFYPVYNASLFKALGGHHGDENKQVVFIRPNREFRRKYKIK